MNFEFPITEGGGEKIIKLRERISQAEINDDNDEVTLLEAELRATERGEEFDRESFIEQKAKSRRRPKHKVLRDMQGLSGAVKDEEWSYDGIHLEKEKSYEETFNQLLSQFGAENFSDFVEQKAIKLGRSIRVLDLFGGAYFLEDLDNVSKIVGVRIKNMDNAFLEQKYGQVKNRFSYLVNNPKRKIIEGDLYKGKTWRSIRDDNSSNSGGEGFDLIVCRPEGPFRNTNLQNIESISDDGVAREEIFVSLLERSLEILSGEDGTLFTQTPNLITDDSISSVFWSSYISKKEEEGYKFIFRKGESPIRAPIFAVRKNTI